MQQDSVGDSAINAVTQPLTDLNLRQKEIPPILIRAQRGPYDLYGLEDCDALRSAVARLNEALGPDADQPVARAGLVNKGLKAGGNVLGGMIPFRGVVRQISGAEAQARRWEVAVFAGVARRSFLKGYMAGKGCQTAEEIPARTAREILGLSAEDEGDHN